VEFKILRNGELAYSLKAQLSWGHFFANYMAYLQCHCAFKGLSGVSYLLLLGLKLFAEM
jgi:hypothetical protein